MCHAWEEETIWVSAGKEANSLWQEVYERSKSTVDRTVTVPWITASEFKVVGDTFAVEVDLGDVTDRQGDGVYSVVVWGTVNGQRTVISEYSIFYGITPPDTYTQGR